MARSQFILEHMHEATLVAHGEQIQVAAKVGPVIKRLYHGDCASGRFELGANPLEARERIGNAVLLAVKQFLRESGKFSIANNSRLLLQRLQGPDYYMMRVSEPKEFVTLCLIEASNVMNRLG